MRLLLTVNLGLMTFFLPLSHTFSFCQMLTEIRIHIGCTIWMCLNMSSTIPWHFMDLYPSCWPTSELLCKYLCVHVHHLTFLFVSLTPSISLMSLSLSVSIYFCLSFSFLLSHQLEQDGWRVLA